jgi:hypothetical protein
MGVTPESYDPLLDVVTMNQLRDILSSMAQSTALAAHGVPSHDSYFSAGIPNR